MIGVFKREKDNLIAAIYSREGLKSEIKAYVYDLDSSFKGEHRVNLISDFNIPVEMDEPELEIILDDLKEKVKTLKYEKRVNRINILLEKYKDESLKKKKKLEFSEKNGFLYFSGNRIEINKFSFYNKKTSIAIIDGIKIEIDIPLEIIEYLEKEEKSY